MPLTRETRDALHRERSRPVGDELYAYDHVGADPDAPMSQADRQWVWRDHGQTVRNRENLRRNMPC